MRPETIIALLGLAALWQAVCSLGVVSEFLLPSPWMVALGVKDLLTVGMPPERLLHKHVIFSLLRVFMGFFLALALAVPMGLLMGWSPRIRRILAPILEIIRPIPPLAWIPIAILWFGIGMKSAAFIIFLGSFFPILLNTLSGVLSIHPVLLEAAKTLRARESDLFFKVLLPGAVPSIFVGLRIGMGIGWMTLVAAEFTGVREGYGLGYMIMTARDIQRPDQILGGMVVIGLIGLFINHFLRALEKLLVRWR